MPRIITMPSTYRIALENLARAQREVQDLAELLDGFAGLLRGAQPEFPGLSLDMYPGLSRLQRALENRDSGREEANRVYGLLGRCAGTVFAAGGTA